MAVHDAIQRAVEGRRIAREDQRSAIERMAAEITQRHEQAHLPVAVDPTHTAETLEATDDGNQG